MEIGGILTIIGLVLAYSTALVGIYVIIMVKLKELDVRILNLQTDFDDHKTANNIIFNELKAGNTSERTLIFSKMDTMLDKITDLRINQGIDSQAAHIAVTAAATAAAAAVVAAVEQKKIKAQ